MATLPCYGLVVDVPTTLNTPPSTKIDHEVIVDHAITEKTQVTNIDKVLQTFETKKLTEATELSSSEDAAQEKKLNFTLKNINVVLLLIEMNQDRESFWKDFKTSYSFSTEGTLQTCHNNEMDLARLSLDGTLIPEGRDMECDCDCFLRSNIVALLFWARDMKGMTTGTISTMNFILPPLSAYEEPMRITRELDDSDRNNMKTENHSEWHLPEPEKPANRASSLTYTANAGEDDDVAWNVVKMFSRMRIALFRSLVESFGGIGIPDEPIPPLRSHVVSSNLADLVGELNSAQNEKGFILVAVTSANEVNSAVKFLQRELSQDTLLVITEVCSHDNKPMRFVAQGPGSKLLHEVSTIWHLPTAIRNIVDVGCQSVGCKTRREVLSVSVTPSKIVPYNIVALNKLSRESVEQLNNTTETSSTTHSKDNEIKKVEDLNVNKETIVAADAKKAILNLKMRSSSVVNKAEFAVTFGTITLVIVAFIFTS
ncbi:uncharacterized protein LOC143185084 [Calliopsis andreniformis]|uniref:uncharacterized protein LOC143185084 n=1 Tax=Calliopsis andreniformis TaxID=337506 RepID=UPI003FCC8CA2